MMIADLKQAGIAYRDDDGQQADFHALRHIYLSNLGRFGASPKAMQRLARHTTVQLTLGRYTHANLLDLKSAVDMLPPISTTSSHESEVVTPQATGTDDIGQSVLQFVLPPGLPERDAKPLVLVHFPCILSRPSYRTRSDIEQRDDDFQTDAQLARFPRRSRSFLREVESHRWRRTSRIHSL